MLTITPEQAEIIYVADARDTNDAMDAMAKREHLAAALREVMPPGFRYLGGALKWDHEAKRLVVKMVFEGPDAGAFRAAVRPHLELLAPHSLVA